MFGEKRKLGRENLGKFTTTRPQWSETFGHKARMKNCREKGKLPYLTATQNRSRGWAWTRSPGKSHSETMNGIRGPSQLDPDLPLLYRFHCTCSHRQCCWNTEAAHAILDLCEHACLRLARICLLPPLLHPHSSHLSSEPCPPPPPAGRRPLLCVPPAAGGSLPRRTLHAVAGCPPPAPATLQCFSVKSNCTLSRLHKCFF